MVPSTTDSPDGRALGHRERNRFVRKRRKGPGCPQVPGQSRPFRVRYAETLVASSVSSSRLRRPRISFRTSGQQMMSTITA